MGLDRAGDCTLDDSLLEDAAFSTGFLAFEGSLGLVSVRDDLDFPTLNRVLPKALVGLDDDDDESLRGLASRSLTSREDELLLLSSRSPLLTALPPPPLPSFAVRSASFLATRLLFPRSADRRLSRCRRALFRNDRPLSSDLLLRRRSVRDDTLGERRLAMDELLLELRNDLRSARTSKPPPLLVRAARRAADPPPPRDEASASGLVCTESRLKLRSMSLFRPPAAAAVLSRPEKVRSRPEKVFLEVGDGEADDCGVEQPRHCFRCGVPS